MPSIPTREESTRREYYDALSPGQTLKTYFWCNQSKKDWRHGSCGIECLSSKCEALSPYLNIKKKPYFFFTKSSIYTNLPVYLQEHHLEWIHMLL
jgi:hypothetical protein